MRIRSVRLGAVLCAGALLASCSPQHLPDLIDADDSAGAGSEGLVLKMGEGERRVRRPRPGSSTAQSAPFILKVDARNGGSPDLVMGYEDIAPGEAIQPHRHLVADEIVFVHRGTGAARLGGRESAVSDGSTLYIPRNTVISLRNTGSEPLGVAFVFSKPGFERLMRDNSVPEGETAAPLSPEEQAEIRERHRWHTIAGFDSTGTDDGGLILQASEGERRILRPTTGAAIPRTPTPFILKVDRRNGGSPVLVMAVQEIAPGDAIPRHQHLLADEIIFVHQGSGLVALGGRESEVSSGSTIYVPRQTQVALRNTGAQPLSIVSVLSKPGFDELMRESSVPEGQPAAPFSAAELARIRARHRWHTVYERP